MTSIAIDRLDGLSSSAAFKGPCRVATTGNIALTGLQTIDGVALVAGNRVLVKSQSTASQNGIYVADPGPWRRARDFESNRDVVKGTRVYVTDGDGAGDYALSVAGTVIIGASALYFFPLVFNDGGTTGAGEYFLADYGVDDNLSDTINNDYIQQLLDGITTPARFIMPPGIFDPDWLIWRSFHHIQGAAGYRTYLKHSIDKAVRFAGASGTHACINLMPDSEFFSGSIAGWTVNTGGVVPTVVNNKLTYTAQTARLYRDIVVPIGVPIAAGFCYDAGSGIYMYLYDGASFSTPLTSTGVVSTREDGLGYVVSTTGIIRFYLYSAGPVTMTIESVSLAVIANSYWQGISHFRVGQSGTLSKNTFIEAGNIGGLIIDDFVGDGTVGQLVRLGDDARYASYIGVERMRGLCGNIQTSLIEARNGVNLHVGRQEMHTGLFPYDPANPGNPHPTTDRVMVHMPITFPRLWDEVCVEQSDVGCFYGGLWQQIKSGPDGQATGLGPTIERHNTLDSNMAFVVRTEIKQGSYSKELSMGQGDNCSVTGGDGFIITGDGEARAPHFGGGVRLRIAGRNGFFCDVLSLAGMVINDVQMHDLDFAETGVAIGLSLVGSNNWKGVTIDNVNIADRYWNDAFPGGAARTGPALGLYVTGAIDRLRVGKAINVHGTTAARLMDLHLFTNSDVPAMPGVAGATGAFTVGASPYTIAAKSCMRLVTVIGTWDAIQIGATNGAYGGGTTRQSFWLPAGRTAIVTYPGATPTINWEDY